MNHFLHGVVRALAETVALPEPVLEIGSYQVHGQEDLINLRSLFPGREYKGLDMRPGPGVDLVADVEALPLPDGSAGTVIAVSTFEHVRHFWKGFAEVRRVLRPGGALLVACPFFFRIHNYPHDYWRFTPKAMEALLEDYPSKLIGWHGTRNRPQNVWALALKEGRPGLTDGQFERYRSLMAKYAHDPEDSWSRSLRYRLASLVCGRGPFDSYLDRNRWDAVLLGADEALPRAA